MPLLLWAGDIADFAPIKIGNKWEYHFYHIQLSPPFGGYSTTVHMQITDVIKINENSKYIVFKNQDSSSTTFDTLVEIDNIISVKSWKCRIKNPLYLKHSIALDSLIKDTLDTNQYLFKKWDGKCYNEYIQNKGLRYVYIEFLMPGNKYKQETKLLSFTNATTIINNTHSIKTASIHTEKIVFNKNKGKASQLLIQTNNNYFLPNGKKLIQPIKVKNKTHSQ